MLKTFNITRTISRTIWLICLLFLSTQLNAQTLNADRISVFFNDFSKENLQEKIYTHTDKDIYITGEIVWFKVYNVASASNNPLEFAKVAYAEIIDKDQKPVMQAKIALEKGSGSGSFHLPLSLASGNYQFRAYTNWMKNFDPEYFFLKPITIVNSITKPENPVEISKNTYDIQFFPEGGNLVEGLKSKIAFRATDNNGKGVDLSGYIIDQNGERIVSFNSLKYGIGSFTLNPAPGKTYRAVIRIAGEQETFKPLPEVYKTGYVMSLTETQSANPRVSIQSNSTSSEQLFLVVHTRQETKISQIVKLNQGKAELIIDASKLGDGISHITIFKAGEPVCERLYFKRPEGKLLIDVKPDQQKYASRKLVTLTLQAKDEKGLLPETDASVSVFADNGDNSNPLDISSYLWLKSDLRGNVEDPGYYFKTNDAQSLQAADNLMLTHGWRRFVWKDALSGKPLNYAFIPELEGHIISGRIIDTRTNLPADKIIANLSLPGKKLQLYSGKSNSLGDVRFFTKDIAGPVELVAQTNSMLDSTYRVDIFSPFSEKYSPVVNTRFALPEQFRNYILNQSIGAQVQNTYLGNKLNVFYAANADSSSFYLKPDKIYLLDNFVRFNTMEEVLREYVSEVIVTRQGENFSLWVPYRAHLSELVRNVEPLLVLDGVPIFDRGNRLIKYDPKKIRSIEVLTQKYYHGPSKFNSIVHFKSYKNNLPDFALDNRATIMDYEGPQLKREFYAPVYDTQNQITSRLPDFRNLLYWSPDVKINGSGEKTISFYTSDQKGKYSVVIQGITSEGKTGSTVLDLEVK